MLRRGPARGAVVGLAEHAAVRRRRAPHRLPPDARGRARACQAHNTNHLVVRVADGLAHGAPPRCPTCGGADLMLEAGMARCGGHLPGGATKCPFVGSSAELHAQRCEWVIPEECLKNRKIKAFVASRGGAASAAGGS